MIYLIQSGKYSKIGYSLDLNNRLITYSQCNPEFELLATREGTKKEETELHRLLKSKIHHGEWMIHSEEIENIFKNHEFKTNSFDDKERKRLEDLIKSLQEDVEILTKRSDRYENGENMVKRYHNNILYFTETLIKLIKENYEKYQSIDVIYEDVLKILSEIQETAYCGLTYTNDKGLAFIKNILESREYTYGELEQIFTPIFKEHNLKWNKKTSIKNYFPDFTKRYKMVNGEREMYYKFDL